MHDHKSEIVSERIGDKEPFAGVVLEPYLWLGHRAFVKESKATSFDF